MAAAPDDQTTGRVREALAGDREAVSWLVERFSPLLRAQAAFRLGPVLGQRIDADDVVAEAWLVSLPRFGDIVARDQRYTPVLLRFLASVVQNIANSRMRAELRRGGPTVARPTPEIERTAALTGVITRAVREERARFVHAAIASLDAPHREVLILRGIEGRPNDEVAELLGALPNTIAQRYRRALAQLRSALPSAVFDELDPD